MGRHNGVPRRYEEQIGGSLILGLIVAALTGLWKLLQWVAGLF